MNSFFYSPLAKEAVMSHTEINSIDYKSFETRYESSSTNNAKILLMISCTDAGFNLTSFIYQKKGVLFY